jgi:hypothetical protein
MNAHLSTWPRRLGRHGILTLGLALLAGAAHAHKAHQHGHARVEVMVEPTSVTVRVEAALDGFVGFERAPRNDGERQRVREAETRLRDGAALFAVDPAAGCTLAQTDLKAAVLGWGGVPPAGAAPAAKPAGGEEHADLEAEWRFDCRDGARAGFVNVGLYAAFPRLRRIEAEAVTPRGQLKQELRRPETRLALTR